MTTSLTPNIICDVNQQQSCSSFNNFLVDERLQNSSFFLLDWPLSRILLKNHADYPWIILIPRRENITEIMQLHRSDREQLIHEIDAASHVLQNIFQPDKLNVGSLGNIVSQLHIHVVGRFQHDPLWPQGIWQLNNIEKPYTDSALLLKQLTAAFANHILHNDKVGKCSQPM